MGRPRRTGPPPAQSHRTDGTPPDERVLEAQRLRASGIPAVAIATRKLVLIGGNHRTVAATQAGLTTLPGYVVTAEPEMVVTLTYEDNRRHGLPPSDAERVAQAIHLIDTGNYTQEGDETTAIRSGARVLVKHVIYKRVMRGTAERRVCPECGHPQIRKVTS